MPILDVPSFINGSMAISSSIGKQVDNARRLSHRLTCADVQSALVLASLKDQRAVHMSER